MASNEKSPHITQFLTSVLPGATYAALRVLTSLKFPIDDYQAFTKQINAQPEGDHDAKGLRDDVVSRLRPSDFPATTVQGLLEKFYARLRAPDLSRFFPPIALPPDMTEKPSIDACREFMTLFGPICGPVACDAFQRVLRTGAPEPSAYYAGIVAGRRC